MYPENTKEDIDYLIYLYCVYRLIVISVKKSRFSKINMKIILCPTFLAITIIRFVLMLLFMVLHPVFCH